MNSPALIPTGAIATPAREDDAFLTAALTIAAARTRTAESRRKYASDLRCWLDYCRAQAADPRAPSVLLVTAYRERLLRDVSSATAARKLSVLSSLYRRLLAAGAATGNPFDADILPRPNNTAVAPHPAVGREVAERMIQCAAEDADRWTGQRDAAVLSLLYWTGARRAEVAGAKRSAVRHENGSTYLRIIRKGGVPAELLLPRPAAAAVAAWATFIDATPGDALFPRRAGAGLAMTPHAVGAVVVERARQARAGHVTAHQFRARFATDALGSVPLHVVQAYMGHADARTTERYDRDRARGDGAARGIEEART